MIDLRASLLLMALLLGTMARHAARRRWDVPAQLARLDATGASRLIGKRAVEMVYWALGPVAQACLRHRIPANAITASSLGLGAAAGLALALGHLGVGGALAVASSLGDVLDGLVARTTGTVTDGGALFDAAADRYQEFLFIGGLAFHYHEREVLLGMALLALVGSFMVSYGSAKADALGVPQPRGSMRRPERAAILCAGALLSPVARLLAGTTHLTPWVVEAPMLTALGLVGVAANASAVLRLRTIARLADAKERGAATAVPVRMRRSSAGASIVGGQ